MPLELYICMSVIECGQFVYNCISRENAPTEGLPLTARDLCLREIITTNER